MVNYDDLPLFPLDVVLFPDMPLPLHIFEPRYRQMIAECVENNAPFGVVLAQPGRDGRGDVVPCSVGTTARITQHETLPDGESNIVVTGETRFRIRDTYTLHPYLSARAEPFWEQTADALDLQAPFDRASGLFKAYLRSLFALSGRTVSAVQLPSDPESLSFAIGSVLQIPLSEKQKLLEMNRTQGRLAQEIDILSREIDAQKLLRSVQRDAGGSGATVTPVDTEALGRLSSRN